MKRTTIAFVAVVVTAALLLSLALPPSLAAANGNPNPGVAPPDANSQGQSYGEWAAAWWSWIASIPVAQNPILDPTGEFGEVGQSGSVWFLAGTFGTEAERDLTVPAGKALFFPLFNSLWWAPDDAPFARDVAVMLGEDPLEVANWSDEEAVVFAAASQVADGQATFTCEVDGVALTDLETYRGQSGPFPLEDTIFFEELGAAVTKPTTGAADGYWVLLNPLKPGEHTVHFTADRVDHPLNDVIPGVFGDFHLEVTYHITVQAGNQP
jgi:hypothetical protein